MQDYQHGGQTTVLTLMAPTNGMNWGRWSDINVVIFPE